METLVHSAQAPQALEEAITLLTAGHPVAVPTETVYGLAADATQPMAVAEVFSAKERPHFDPLIVHLPDMAAIKKLTRIPEEDVEHVVDIADEFWPGPLTMVLPRTDTVPDIVCAGLPTVAVRLPSHPVLHELLEKFGRPLAAPSANRFGRVSPTHAEHVLKELRGRIPLILDAGPTKYGVESTIIRPRQGKIEVLRPGPVTLDDLKRFGEVFQAQKEEIAAPGMLAAHYSPATPLDVWSEEITPAPEEEWGLLSWDIEDVKGYAMVEKFSRSKDLREAATRLFGCLRKLDEAGLDHVVAQLVPEEGLGVAINDRLRRAAAQKPAGS